VLTTSYACPTIRQPYDRRSVACLPSISFRLLPALTCEPWLLSSGDWQECGSRDLTVLPSLPLTLISASPAQRLRLHKQCNDGAGFESYIYASSSETDSKVLHGSALRRDLPDWYDCGLTGPHDCGWVR